MVRNLEVLRALLARAVGLSADSLCGVSEYLGWCLDENCIIHSGTCSTGIYRCSLHGVCWARGLPRCCPSRRGAFRWIQGPGNPLTVEQVSQGAVGTQKSGKGTHAEGLWPSCVLSAPAGASAMRKGPLSEPRLSPCRTGTDSVLPVSLPRPCPR